MAKSLLAAVVLFVTAQIALSQNWVLTGAGTNWWSCTTVSADGNTLIAGQWPGSVGVSTDGGATWTTNVLTNGYWTSVASTADGTKLLAAAANVDSTHTIGVFLSTNSGVSWVSNSLPPLNWNSVAISADGNTMAAVPFSVATVFCSTNAGLSWVSNSLVDPSYLSSVASSVAMSADGSKIFVAAALTVFDSTNFGISWMQMTNAPTLYGEDSGSQYIASSADGNKLVMCAAPSGDSLNFIYTSTNAGETWNLTSLPAGLWTDVASSADGTTLMAAGGLSHPWPFCISTNSGASWTSNSTPTEYWENVACSADGGKLVAAANPLVNIGAIYVSQSTQPPLLSIAPAGTGNGSGTGNDLQLSWLIPSTDFVLEQSADLNNWSVVTNTPALNLANLNDRIVVSPTNIAGFYRLVH